MVAALLKSKQITAVVVGADRVAANGDTANKIGTYQVNIATDNNVTCETIAKLVFGSHANVFSDYRSPSSLSITVFPSTWPHRAPL